MPASDFENILYWGDLDESSSRHDRTRAGPSEQGLVIMWSIYSPFLFIFSFVIVVVFLGIVTNPKVRKNPFNKYVLFLSFPDFLYSFCCFFTCLLSAINNGYSSWAMCQFQVAYLHFGAAANAWLNGVMAYEIHQLLRSSRIRKRYFPPTDRQVYRNAALGYGLAALAACLPLLGNLVDWIPSPGLQAGFVCTASETTVGSSIFWWLILAPLVFAFPYLFALYVFVDVILWSKLLPPRGKRRELSVYFFRIGAMFLFLWMPTVVGMYILRGVAGPWVVWGLGLFSHSQGLISALLTLGKDDVRRAVWNFVRRCVCLPELPQDDPKKSGSQKRRKTGSTNTSSSTLRISGLEAPINVYRPRTTDDMGLPLQGSNFEFLDETSAEQTDEEQQRRRRRAPPSSEMLSVDDSSTLPRLEERLHNYLDKAAASVKTTSSSHPEDKNGALA